MPEPRDDETKDDFMQRCMSSDEANADFPDQSQRAAFCQSQWDRMSDNIHTIKSNLQAPEGVRRDVFEGVEHLVVPVVMIVDGVLNGALLTQEEYGRYVESWNGRPVPVLHPERNGMPTSANQPDIIEKNTIGTIFNARVDDGKLKAEAWINTDKAKRLGYTELLSQLESGEIVEVSTGYFSDSEPKVGQFNGNEYREIHRNIRPDHLALLPNEEGACSAMDGCGTRVNKGFMLKVNEAMNVLRQAVGLQTQCSGGCTGQCNCKGGIMPDKKTLVQRAEKLHANEKLTADQMEMLQNLAEDAQQLKMAKAFLDAVEESAKPDEDDMPSPDEVMADDEYMNALAQNQKFMEKLNANSKSSDKDDTTVSQDKVDELVNNRVDEAIRRRDVVAKLTTNEKNPFSETEMKTMSVDHLEKLEKSIRPADYSGQGGFAGNSDAIDTNVQPLTLNKGVLRKKEAS